MTAGIKSYGVNPMRDVMDSLGGWPVVVGNKWDNTTFDWINVTEIMRKLGYSADMVVQFKVVVHPNKNTKNLLYVS